MNKANVKAVFNEPSCKYESAGCLNHSLQLVIKKGIFSDRLIQIAKSRNLSYASYSTIFYTELYRQQEIQADIKDSFGLKNDIATRWNSTIACLLFHALANFTPEASHCCQHFQKIWKKKTIIINFDGFYCEVSNTNPTFKLF